jgi:hypothetical protein
MIRVSDIVVTVVPVVSTAPAYTSGDNVGGKLTILDAVSVVGPSLLKSLTIVDRGNQKAAMDLLLFKAPLTGAYTDNAAQSIATADIANLIGRFAIAAIDFTTETGTANVAIAEYKNIDKVLFSADVANQLSGGQGGNVYGLLVTTGIPTYLTASDLQLIFGIQRGNIGVQT